MLNRWEPFTTTELLALSAAIQRGTSDRAEVARYLLRQITVELSEREANAAAARAGLPEDHEQ
jgi:hypothetical protein